MTDEALKIAEKRREAKGKGKKERYIYPFEFRVSKNSKETKESLPQWSMQIEEKNRREGLEISSRKLEIPREHFMQNEYNKGQK